MEHEISDLAFEVRCQVVSAVAMAWQVSGHMPTFVDEPDQMAQHLALVSVDSMKRIEAVLYEVPDEPIWQELAEIEPAEEWTMCVLIPLSGVGRAHERLRGTGCTVQGWWANDEGSIEFGSTQIA